MIHMDDNSILEKNYPRQKKKGKGKRGKLK